MNTLSVSGGGSAWSFPHVLVLSVLIALISLIFLEKRKAEAERIRQKYPDRIPVRCNAVSLGRYGYTDVTLRLRTGHL